MKLQERLGVNKNELKIALNLISRLNPKPGGSLSGSNQNTQVVPDFILNIWVPPKFDDKKTEKPKNNTIEV